MPMPTITIKKTKDGRPVAWFREQAGIVRTSVGVIGAGWVKAEKVRLLAEYGIQLQLQQAAAGIGSGGAPMKALSGSVVRYDKEAKGFRREGYGQWKAAHGLAPIRDLRGPGKDGHMLDDIRVNYVDDKRATFAITRNAGRIKALANERRSPWWGWSPASVRALAQRSGEIFPQGVAERLMTLGLAGATSMSGAGRMLRRVA